jgi:hypothetical protein
MVKRGGPYLVSQAWISIFPLNTESVVRLLFEPVHLTQEFKKTAHLSGEPDQDVFTKLDAFIFQVHNSDAKY